MRHSIWVSVCMVDVLESFLVAFFCRARSAVHAFSCQFGRVAPPVEMWTRRPDITTELEIKIVFPGIFGGLVYLWVVGHQFF